MVLQFGISNFLSYDEPAVIQLSSNTKETAFSTDYIGFKQYKILKYASIFGTNASGKSSLIKSVRFFTDCVRNNKNLERGSSFYCKVKKENEEKISSFEIVILYKEYFYQYGFGVILKTGKIQEEYLNKITPSTNKSTEIFRRSSESGNYVDYIKTSLINNRLIISLIGESEETIDKKYYDEIKGVYEYISKRIVVIDNNTSSNYLFTEKEIDSNFIKILHAFDFNISKVKKTNIPWDVFSGLVKPEIVADVRKAILSNPNKKSTLFLQNKFYYIEVINDDINITKIGFEHYNSENPFDFGEESDGTLRIMDFIPIFFIKTQLTFFIDEIERSLSSDMVVQFFKMLRDAGNISQIVYTTHEDELFDHNNQRIDSIYIVVKDSLGTSHLRRLSQFKNIYKENNINDKYLQGRYGGRSKFYNTEI